MSKKSGQGEFADAKLDAAQGHAGCEREESGLLAGGLVGEPEDLVNLIAGDVGGLAQVGVADHVEVAESGQAVGLAEAAAFGGFDVEDEVSVVTDGVVGAQRGVECAHHGGLVLAPGMKLFFPW